MAKAEKSQKEAIVRINGSQYLVREGEEFEVDRISEKTGAKITPEVLYTADGDKVSVGAPLVKDGKVSLEVVKHTKGEKVSGMRFKAKARYRRRFGSRPSLTVLKVAKIG